ncbi:hypothetical protein K443DRAFT_683728 [Laccaria amethystina LaAM-08-1]|uniref:Uncharacterized protein n=1 Tax=Laccaria amethystina LaAM-08-1 TaxID=1095629 RepID=A0A0C9X9W9_9AGAR|nr:hypothetical protein K443DRAFT_683728 [Laccaria amethystina LaAM-08-1]
MRLYLREFFSTSAEILRMLTEERATINKRWKQPRYRSPDISQDLETSYDEPPPMYSLSPQVNLKAVAA